MTYAASLLACAARSKSPPPEETWSPKLASLGATDAALSPTPTQRRRARTWP